jgi:hypothetical protein
MERGIEKIVRWQPDHRLYLSGTRAVTHESRHILIADMVATYKANIGRCVSGGAKLEAQRAQQIARGR